MSSAIAGEFGEALRHRQAGSCRLRRRRCSRITRPALRMRQCSWCRRPVTNRRRAVCDGVIRAGLPSGYGGRRAPAAAAAAHGRTRAAIRFSGNRRRRCAAAWTRAVPSPGSGGRFPTSLRLRGTLRSTTSLLPPSTRWSASSPVIVTPALTRVPASGAGAETQVDVAAGLHHDRQCPAPRRAAGARPPAARR